MWLMYLLSIAILIVGSLLTPMPWRIAAAAGLLAIAVVAARRDEIEAAVIAALGVVVIGTASSVTPSIWIAAAVAGVVWWRMPQMRVHLGPVRAGRLDPLAAVFSAATVVVAAIALALWAGLFGDATFDDAESSVARIADQIDAIPGWLFPFGALAFALANAIAEEFVYRGILLHNLLPLGVTTAVVMQAMAFGAVHLNGFPSGWLGVAMATVYGLALGWLRIRTDGLLWPVTVHVTADVAIAFLVRFLA